MNEEVIVPCNEPTWMVELSPIMPEPGEEFDPGRDARHYLDDPTKVIAWRLKPETYGEQPPYCTAWPLGDGMKWRGSYREVAVGSTPAEAIDNALFIVEARVAARVNGWNDDGPA